MERSRNEREQPDNEYISFVDTALARKNVKTQLNALAFVWGCIASSDIKDFASAHKQNLETYISQSRHNTQREFNKLVKSRIIEVISNNDPDLARDYHQKYYELKLDENLAPEKYTEARNKMLYFITSYKPEFNITFDGLKDKLFKVFYVTKNDSSRSPTNLAATNATSGVTMYGDSMWNTDNVTFKKYEVRVKSGNDKGYENDKGDRIVMTPLVSSLGISLDEKDITSKLFADEQTPSNFKIEVKDKTGKIKISLNK